MNVDLNTQCHRPSTVASVEQRGFRNRACMCITIICPMRMRRKIGSLFSNAHAYSRAIPTLIKANLKRDDAKD